MEGPDSNPWSNLESLALYSQSLAAGLTLLGSGSYRSGAHYPYPSMHSPQPKARKMLPPASRRMLCLWGNIGKDNNSRLYDLGLAKSSFGFFLKIVWKTPNFLGQPREAEWKGKGTVARGSVFWSSFRCQSACVIICCCSIPKLGLTLSDPMDCSTPAFPVLHYLPEFAQTHVLWVSDAIQPSHPLPPASPALKLSQHQGPFQWVGSLHQMVNVLEL